MRALPWTPHHWGSLFLFRKFSSPGTPKHAEIVTFSMRLKSSIQVNRGDQRRR